MTGRSERYVVVSTDNLAGPSLVGQLRAYCPQKHLGDFDEYALAREVR